MGLDSSSNMEVVVAVLTWKWHDGEVKSNSFLEVPNYIFIYRVTKIVGVEEFLYV